MRLCQVIFKLLICSHAQNDLELQLYLFFIGENLKPLQVISLNSTMNKDFKIIAPTLGCVAICNMCIASNVGRYPCRFVHAHVYMHVGAVQAQNSFLGG